MNFTELTKTQKLEMRDDLGVIQAVAALPEFAPLVKEMGNCWDDEWEEDDDDEWEDQRAQTRAEMYLLLSSDQQMAVKWICKEVGVDQAVKYVETITGSDTESARSLAAAAVVNP